MPCKYNFCAALRHAALEFVRPEWSVHMLLRAARLILAIAFGITGIGTGLSWAQTYPSKPIRFIVPFPAGGSTDAVARAMQPALEKLLGQPVVVENRAGAGGVLGVDAIAKAAPDGYTIGIAGAGALGVNVGERIKRPYDPAKDLTPISKAAGTPFVLVAPPTLSANSLGDVIKLAKAEPGRLSIGHGGNGTAMQLTALTLVSMADVKINLVPYRGTAPAMFSSRSPTRRRRWARSARASSRRLASRRRRASRCFRMSRPLTSRV
jgi:tripartite-type tricarboxylate transporter receptor subunit TctC